MVMMAVLLIGHSSSFIKSTASAMADSPAAKAFHGVAPVAGLLHTATWDVAMLGMRGCCCHSMLLKS